MDLRSIRELAEKYGTNRVNIEREKDKNERKRLWKNTLLELAICIGVLIIKIFIF